MYSQGFSLIWGKCQAWKAETKANSKKELRVTETVQGAEENNDVKHPIYLYPQREKKLTAFMEK